MINSQNQIFLIDYGIAQRFELPDGSHKPDLGFIGYGLNYHFSSKNALNGHALSRRDDLI